MNPADFEADTNALHRLARMHARDISTVTIDAQGIHITVISEEAAARLVEPHGMARGAKSSMVHVWTGTIGVASVTVRIGTEIPAQRGAVA